MTGPARKIIVHHTASANVTDYSLSAAYKIARDIQQWHFARGWADSGQHFTVSRGGYTLEGRHRTIEGLGSGSSSIFPLGAHCLGQNGDSIGIENQGTYTTSTPTSAQWSALVGLLAYLCQTYKLPVSQIFGHRQYVSTSCPGDAFYAKLPQLRSDVSARLGGVTPPPVPTTRSWPTLQVGSTGTTVKAAQYLLRHSGRTLAVDGDFGSGTKAAVVSFQNAQGLTADGVIGRRTWEAPLAVLCRQGDVNNAVRGAQTRLVAKGYSIAVDGSFGPATLSATRSFQQSRGLVVDGLIGLDTWAKLVS